MSIEQFAALLLGMAIGVVAAVAFIATVGLIWDLLHK